MTLTILSNTTLIEVHRRMTSEPFIYFGITIKESESTGSVYPAKQHLSNCFRNFSITIKALDVNFQKICSFSVTVCIS
jgi:hypothetical protein